MMEIAAVESGKKYTTKHVIWLCCRKKEQFLQPVLSNDMGHKDAFTKTSHQNDG